MLGLSARRLQQSARSAAAKHLVNGRAALSSSISVDLGKDVFATHCK